MTDILISVGFVFPLLV